MIRGDLDRLHLGDLLQWLHMGRLSGRLALTADGCERRLDFLEGTIVFVSSVRPEERLGSWLAREGVLPAERLRQLLAVSLVRGTLFTDVLIDGGVPAEVLRPSLARLATTIATRTLLAREVKFAFDPGYPVRNLLNLNLDVAPQTLVMEAARQSDEASRDGAQPDEEVLPSSGEAYERFFWQLIGEAAIPEEPLEGEQLVALHATLRGLMSTLAQWLASSPGLVPLPEPQADAVAEQLGRSRPLPMRGQPHVVWNRTVLACSIRSLDLERPTGLKQLAHTVEDRELWLEMAGPGRWRRPAADRLDQLATEAASLWSRAAAAAARHLEASTEAAALAAHLLTVPTDLVLWVLATVPVPHLRLRQALLRSLPRRLTVALAYRADFPPLFRDLIDLDQPTPLGLSLALGRAVLPSATIWPQVVSEEQCRSSVATSKQAEKAAAAARRACKRVARELAAVG